MRQAHAEPILLHDEPVYRNGEIVGRTTSGSYGYAIGSSVALAYLATPKTGWQDWIDDGDYEIEIADIRFPARASRRPFHDPEGLRIMA